MSALPAALVARRKWSILSFMGDAVTVLSTVHRGDIWRVEITWPNGKKNYVGEFSSENDATAWINKHAWWITKPPVAENTTSEPSEPSSAA